MSGKESTAQTILHRLRIPWPDADEGKLREAANAWRNLARSLDSTTAMANREASSLTSANYGPAITAFEKQWSLYGDKTTGLLPLGVNACNTMAKGCDDFADKVEETKRKIERAAIEVGATLAIGAVGAFLTFGASEAAAAGIAASLSTTVLGEISILGGSAAEIAGFLSASALYGAFSTALGENTLNAVRAILGDKLPGAGAEFETLLKGMLSGVVSGTAGKGASLTTAQMEKVLNQAATATATSDPALSQTLAQISRSLTGSGGKIVQGVTMSGATQMIMNQQLNGKGLAASGLNKSITEALEKAQGK